MLPFYLLSDLKSNLKIFTRYLSILLILPGVFLVADCKGGETKEGDTPEIEYKLNCVGGQAIREHFDTKLEKVRERGPVETKHPLTGAAIACDVAAKLKNKEIGELPRTGNWTGYHTDTGKIFFQGEYKKDRREGEFVFNNNEQLRIKVVNYKNGLKDGPEINYYAGTNEWKKKGQNSKGQKTGLWQTKISRESDCLTEGNYSKNKKTGQWVECRIHTDEKDNKIYYVSFRGSYKGGLRNGPAESFYPNGKLGSQGSYWADFECLKDPPKKGGKDACGKHSGPWQIFYPQNGNLYMKGSYNRKTDERIGTWTEYYISGEKSAQGPRNDTKEGMWTYWDKQGVVLGKFNMFSEFTFNGGTIYKNGRLKAQPLPAKGEDEAGAIAQGTASFDMKKDLIEIEVGPLMGRWRLFDDNGVKRSEGGLKFDQRHGHSVFYDESGRKIGEGNFMLGNKHGVYNELKNGRWVSTEYFMGEKKQQ